MRVSILINNFNYARFVGAAIDSALSQTHDDVEVVVCDDGSVDGSWDVIERELTQQKQRQHQQPHSPRLRAWRSPDNLGQASAMNAGMALCTGDWVLFLDADDQLDPEAIARCSLHFKNPLISKVQFRLRCVDSKGHRLGRQIPHVLHDGDVTPLIRRFGSYGGPPSSGNVYRRSAIAKYFPLDMAPWRRAADTPPFLLSAFHGEVVSITDTLGSYRVHSAVNQARGCFGNITTRHAEVLLIEQHRQRMTRHLLAEHDHLTLAPAELPTPWALRTRALSWRLEPDQHPFTEDCRGRLWHLHEQSLQACPGYRWTERLAARLWLVLALWVPRRWIDNMAQANHSGRWRRWVKQLSGALAW